MAVTRQSWEASLAKIAASLAEFAPSQAQDASALEELRLSYLGRKGSLANLLRDLKDLPIEAKRELGPKAQALKADLESKINARRLALESAADEAALSKGFDLTLPASLPARGRRHPLTSTLDEMTRILGHMGFSLADGPLVETDYYNFEALNIPEHHSARDSHDTFYLQDMPLLMRTHTSPVQIRAMQASQPPIRIMAPGRVYRHEAVDATHSAVFHQVEGLAVDRTITFADLKGVLQTFLKELLGPETKSRFRPSYFPFTEPSTEVDASCFFCKAKGCHICKQSGWIELLGAGVVNPKVLSAVGWNPEEWSGFAFGIGVERLAMLRHGISDIRQFYENDLRFLRQFDESLV